MSACNFCGPQFDVTGKFCPNCGKPQEGNFDDQQNLQHFAEIVQDSFFEIEEWQTQDGFLKLTKRVREKLLISHDASVNQFNNLKKYFDEKQPLSEFQLEFNQNVIDAYAGHDTYLQFRFTNKSSSGDNYKVYIFWDDRETEDEDDLHIRSNTLIKPNQSIELGGTHIFMRAGPKEISELTITVTNQFKEEAKFKVTPFNFRVKTPTQNVINQITTKNEISIEGRGVVDAANMGTQQPLATENNEPTWVNLEHFLLPEEVNNILVSNSDDNLNSTKATQGYCSGCGEPYFDSDEIACTHCNLAHSMQTNPSRQFECGGCGYSNNDIDDKFCSNCGLEILNLSTANPKNEFKKTPGGNLWSGDFDDNGHAHGHGKLQIVKDEGEWQHDDVEFYEGNIYHSEITDLSGKAEIKYRSGDNYIGTVYDLKPHGMGTKTFGVTEGKAYKGMYCLGDRHGLQECYEIEERYSSDGTIEGFDIGEFVQGECFADDTLQGTGYITNDDWFRITNAEWDHGNNWVGYWSHPEEDGTSSLYAGFENNAGHADLDCDQDSPFYGLVVYGYNIDEGSVQGIYHGHINNKFRQGQGTYIANNFYFTEGEWYEGMKHGLHNERNAGEIEKHEILYDNDEEANDSEESLEVLEKEIHTEEVGIESNKDTSANLTICGLQVPKHLKVLYDRTSVLMSKLPQWDNHYFDYEWFWDLGYEHKFNSKFESQGMFGVQKITEKKRNNIYSFISNNDRKILMVFDDTVFGSCKEFVLFMTDSFWFKKGKNATGLRYRSITEAKLFNNKLKLDYIKDGEALSMIVDNVLPKKDTLQLYVHVLNELKEIAP